MQLDPPVPEVAIDVVAEERWLEQHEPAEEESEHHDQDERRATGERPGGHDGGRVQREDD